MWISSAIRRRALASAGLDKNQLFPCHKFRTRFVLTARLLTLLFTTFHPIETVSMSSAEFENYVFSRGGNRLIRTVLIASNGRAFFNFSLFYFSFFFLLSFFLSFLSFSRSLVLSLSSNHNRRTRSFCVKDAVTVYYDYYFDATDNISFYLSSVYKITITVGATKAIKYTLLGFETFKSHDVYIWFAWRQRTI